MEEGRFRLDDFELYKIAREFRKRAYRLLKQLPSEEKHALRIQMRRAAVSVTNNIAEGHGAGTTKRTSDSARSRAVPLTS